MQVRGRDFAQKLLGLDFESLIHSLSIYWVLLFAGTAETAMTKEGNDSFPYGAYILEETGDKYRNKSNM